VEPTKAGKWKKYLDLKAAFYQSYVSPTYAYHYFMVYCVVIHIHTIPPGPRNNFLIPFGSLESPLISFIHVHFFEGFDLAKSMEPDGNLL